jgi:hypothetical protein
MMLRKNADDVAHHLAQMTMTPQLPRARERERASVLPVR